MPCSLQLGVGTEDGEEADRERQEQTLGDFSTWLEDLEPPVHPKGWLRCTVEGWQGQGAASPFLAADSCLYSGCEVASGNN